MSDLARAMFRLFGLRVPLAWHRGWLQPAGQGRAPAEILAELRAFYRRRPRPWRPRAHAPRAQRHALARAAGIRLPRYRGKPARVVAPCAGQPAAV